MSHRRKFIDASELGQFILEISKILGALKLGIFIKAYGKVGNFLVFFYSKTN